MYHHTTDPTIVVDLDGTICSKVVDRQYEKAEPVMWVINHLNSLKENGWKVVVFTGRGMITYDGDVQAIEKRWRDIVERQLFEWGLKYDILVFGKPSGDHYLDDKALHLHELPGLARIVTGKFQGEF